MTSPRRRAPIVPLLLLMAASLSLGLPQPVWSHSPMAAARADVTLPPAPEMLPSQAGIRGCAPAPETAGSWTFLSDLAWDDAQTGWQAIADDVTPQRDVSFSRNPLVLGGAAFDKGLGTYPFSEVTYHLDGAYSAFQAQVGLNADAAPNAAAVFLVYADGTLVYNSGEVRGGAPPIPLDLCVAGVGTLRLVTAFAHQRTPPVDDLPPEAYSSYTDWAAARVFRPASTLPSVDSAAGAIREALNTQAAARRRQVIGELGVYRQYGAAAQQAVAAGLGRDLPAAGWPAAAQAFRDGTGRLALAHRRLAVLLGFGGPEHARLTVLDPSSGVVLVDRAASAVATSAGLLSLSADTLPAAPDSFAFDRVDDPALGPGSRVRATLRPQAAPGGASVEIRVTLYDDRPSFTYQVTLDGWPAAGLAGGATGPPTRFDYFSSGDPAFVLGDGAHYVAEASYVREAALADDGLWRTARLGLAKPAALWGNAVPAAPGSTTNSGSVVLSLLDEQRLPAWLVVRRDPGHAATAAGISQPLPTPALTGRSATPASGPSHVDGPRLLVQLAGTTDLRAALADYRHIVAQLYPPARLPDWLRYQWGSWWVYGSSIDEDKIRRQIDLIANELGDLGPWHILVDAGWEDVGPDGSDDLGQENRTRFPHGLRALIDYAHARGIRVILFYSAVYGHDGTGKGEWLGFPRLIGQHRDWFIPLTPDGMVPARVLFDYTNPATRDYLTSVLTRYVADYGADGVKIDGLGDVEGALIPLGQRASVFSRRWALTPVMDVYRTVARALWRVKPDAFIESGWVNPATAQPYAHTFRYGDEWNVFDQGYPFPGLAQHFTYAAVQQGVLGQRPNVGATFGGLNQPLSDQWLGAALATGAQVSLGSDLTFVSSQGFAGLRALLVHLRPFAGTTRTGPEGFGLQPGWAATTAGDLTFVGLLNRQSTAQHADLRLDDAGVNAAAGADALAYDVNNARFFRVRDVLATDVPAQTLALIVLRATPGVVWTTSSYEEQPSGQGWRVLVRGPADVDGLLQFHLPGRAPSAVLLDGAPLAPVAPDGEAAYSYDAAAGVLTVRYSHAGLQPGLDNQPARTIDVLR